MIRIGCGTVCYRALALQEALERIARAGYRWVETQATAPFCPHIDPWKDDPEAFRRQVSDLGFQGVSALWAPQGAIIPDPQSVRGVTAAVQWAGAAGIPVVNAGDGHKPDDMSDEDALKVLGDRLQEILIEAERSRVYVAIEPHGTFSLTPEGLKRIMGLVESPWLGINYDTANVHRATYVETVEGAYSWTPFGEAQDEVATLREVMGRVVHVHAKDVIGPTSVALGEGEVDVVGCLRVLMESGYDGVVSLETEGELAPDEMQTLIEQSRLFMERQVTGVR
jgi:sugar phosphate isomerase/epimerase